MGKHDDIQAGIIEGQRVVEVFSDNLNRFSANHYAVTNTGRQYKVDDNEAEILRRVVQ